MDKKLVGEMELDSTYTVEDVQKIGSELESIQSRFGIPPPARITTKMSKGNEGAASEYVFGTNSIGLNTRDQLKKTKSMLMGKFESNKAKNETYFPRATTIETLQDVIDHEEAHRIHDLASKAIGRDITKGEAYGTEVLGRFVIEKDEYGVRRPSWADKYEKRKGNALALDVSMYASKNPMDLFAEAFVLYKKNPNDLSEELRSVVEGAIKLAGGRIS